jgi:hypothetical protein
LVPFPGSDSADQQTALDYGRFEIPVTIHGQTLQVMADASSRWFASERERQPDHDIDLNTDRGSRRSPRESLTGFLRHADWQPVQDALISRSPI